MKSLPQDTLTPVRSRFFYGWVVVGISTVMMAITYGLMYSYGVFFKPLAEYFNWDRATVSAIYSASLIIRGAISIGTGWLADRYGAARLMAFCGFMIGLGLILSGQVRELWQLFITYAIIEAIGLSGTFGIATAITSRWFTKNRGLALGIVSCGTGLGTLIIVPGAERLIAATDWSKAFIIIGMIAGIIMISASFFLKPPPAGQSVKNLIVLKTEHAQDPSENINMPFAAAIRSPRMILLISVFILIFFCTQLVIVHLVNNATDRGISPFVAASLISIIGLVGIAGRLTMGIGADKLGIYNTLILCSSLLALALILLIFTNSLWTFYLFAAAFGFAYGGEVPLIPLFISHFFGIRSMAALMGFLLFISNIGGALGPWVGGKIYDLTGSYRIAFLIGAIAGIILLLMSIVLKKFARKEVKA